MLTAKQIMEAGIITNVTNPKSVQQIGIDLEVVAINSVSGIGVIGIDKTSLPAYSEIEPKKSPILKKTGWYLKPGVYEVTFKQGCKIPEDGTMLIRQRSSIARSGGNIHSSVFDPGFETDQMGTFMTIHHPLFIEEGARICQAYVHEHEAVTKENQYKGQFQNDNQRKEK